MAKPIINITSNDWVAIKVYISEQLDILYKKLKNPVNDINETQVLRGHILALESLLSIEDHVIKYNQNAASH